MKTALTAFHKAKTAVRSLSMVLGFARYAKNNGRPIALSIDDIVAMGIVWKDGRIKTKKKLWEHLRPHRYCSYKTMVVNMNRFAFLTAFAIVLLMKRNRTHATDIKHTDSTAVPVCLLKNSGRHKTMAGIASKGHNGNGYYFGLKPHMTSDLHRSILALRFTDANNNEREVFAAMNDELTGAFLRVFGICGGLVRGYLQRKKKNRPTVLYCPLTGMHRCPGHTS